ncbi:class I SAM-dependent methyltransferase [Pseudoduganella sp. RAF53_2]|uniref:class I SAM-dependent methyltransferase n=1 Tax=unclassified Pseudoduganella TaxID=2637179 RepID=UPI003F9BFC98
MSTTDQLFTKQSDAYRAARPGYDPQLFAWLAELAPGRALAWEAGCGSGQATIDVAKHFDKVIATDVSQPQIDRAPAAANVSYRCEPSQQSSLEAGSVDLTLVAQALHWFDIDGFYNEVRRVSKPGAPLAVISYNLLEASPQVDVLIHKLYNEVLNGYWAPERAHVENGYRSIPFPFQRIETPAAMLTAQWDLKRFMAYLESWSAIQTYKEKNGADPLAPFRDEFARCWGDPQRLMTINWPLSVRVGVVDGKPTPA